MTQQMVRNVKIIGTGSYVPEEIRDNHWFERVGSSDEWISTNLGIKQRHIVAEGELTSDMAAKAGKRAIEQAGLKPEDIDLVILSTFTPDRKAPSTAAITVTKLGMENAAAFDLNATCAGSVVSYATGAQFIATSMYQNVLVISSEVCSTVLDWTRRDCCFLGDGAGACVLSASNSDEGFLHFDINANGVDKDIVTVKAGGVELPVTQEVINSGQQYWYMNGREVYNQATVRIPESIIKSLNACGLTAEDVDHVIPHQPGKGMLSKVSENVGVPWEKFRTNYQKYANTSSSTIPIMLDECNRDGLLKQDDIIVFGTIGGGMTWASAVYKCG